MQAETFDWPGAQMTVPGLHVVPPSMKPLGHANESPQMHSGAPVCVQQSHAGSPGLSHVPPGAALPGPHRHDEPAAPQPIHEHMHDDPFAG